MKIISALASTAVTAILLSATPSHAQFFDPLFEAPAAAVQAGTGIATGAVGAATGIVGAATGGFFGGYPDNYDVHYGWNTWTGWNNPGYGAAYYPGWSNGWSTPSYGYAQTAPAYGTRPVVTGRSAYRSYRQWRRSPDNQYN